MQSILNFVVHMGLDIPIELWTYELIWNLHSSFVAMLLQENKRYLWWLICHWNITQTVDLAYQVNGEVQFIGVQDFILFHKSKDLGLLFFVPTNEEPCWDIPQSRSFSFYNDSITSLKYGLSTVEFSLFLTPSSVLKSSTSKDILSTMSSCQMQPGQSLKTLELLL